MKKIFLFAIAMLATSMAMAIPAHPGKGQVTQPDGSTLTVRLLGDEYLHFTTTDDGYTVVQRADGFFTYAQLDADGQLQPTAQVAHDADQRTAGEQLLLQTMPRRLAPTMTTETRTQQQAEQQRRAKTRQRAAACEPEYDYANFRGLILLVEFNDRQFSRHDFAAVASDMMNMENYTGYDQSAYGRFTGSVRDYFYDNSGGLFSPQFDVVGPVTIDYSQYDANGTQNSYRLMKAAIDAADEQVDFSQYDGDGDGFVDMVYFIYAGIGSNIGGNDSRLIWPHATTIVDPDTWWYMQRDGVMLGRAACSTELYGSENWHILSGIGVICHEFSHVLGLPDLYDTDYDGTNGQSAHPGEWCIMAAAGYLNNERTPAGYTLYERYAIGFATPQVIEEEGSYTLEAIGESNTGYRLNTPVKREYFLLENRQKTSKWDAYLAGHGLLVFRVDSTNTSVWRNNSVNNNPKHNYFELVRAKGASTSKTNPSEAQTTDPFPGTGRVTLLNNSTEPANLLTWAGRATPFGLENIKESGGKITFDIVDVNVLKSISLPETCTVGKGLATQLKETRTPDYAPYTLAWTSADETVATVDQNGLVTGVKLGETYITVVANDNAELTATCHITVEETAIASSIAEYKQLEPQSQGALLLNEALVVYVDGDDAYVRDASGAIVLSETGLELEAGDQLNGNIFGQFTREERMPLLLPVEGRTNASGITISQGHEVKPRELKLEEVDSTCYADLVTLKEVQLLLEPQVAMWLQGEKKIRLFNKFKVKDGGKVITTPTDYDGKYYDITGIFLTDQLKDETVDELALLKRFVEVVPAAVSTLPADVDSTTPAQVYTADGRLAARTTVGQLSQLPLRHGIYVVKTAKRTWRIGR